MSTTVPEAVGAATFKYWAFISYSHRDKRWADWLHRALETYRVPKRIIGQPTGDGPRPKRLFPIFRDREELSASADLGAKVNQALIESRYLIVVCSPNAAKSVWVDEEVKFFKKLGREDRVLALIVGGEPNSSDGTSESEAKDESFPQALRYRVDADGKLLPARAEPVAADVRENKDGKTNAKLKLVAGLLDLDFDRLRQREQERRRRSLMAMTASAGAVAVLMTTLAGYAFLQRQKARAQARLAENRRLAAQASERQANDARDQADGLINFMLHDLRDKLQPIGRLDVLDDVAKKAKQYLDRLLKELVTPSRLGQRAALFNNLGDVLVAQGKLPEAVESYRQSLKIWQTLAEQDKSNTDGQRNLSISFEKVGDVLLLQGKLDQALAAYRQDCEIRRKVVQSNPMNADLRQDLSWSLIKVGDALQEQGETAQALDSYQQSREIRRKLAQQDPTNTDWQRDLSVALERVGMLMLLAQGKGDQALPVFQQDLEICQKLNQQDPTNAGWQRDLAISLNYLGEALLSQDKGDEAMAVYEQSRDICQKLVQRDPTNAGCQDNLEAALINIGDVLFGEGNLARALKTYREAFAIAEKLASQDRTNSRWQGDAAWIRYCVAKVLMRDKDGDRTEARRLVLEGINILTRLEQQGALNPAGQDTLNKLNELAAAPTSSPSCD
jgi:eukaryotic-like serine/threonine-protein kinase